MSAMLTGPCGASGWTSRTAAAYVHQLLVERASIGRAWLSGRRVYRRSVRRPDRFRVARCWHAECCLWHIGNASARTDGRTRRSRRWALVERDTMAELAQARLEYAR